MQGHIKLEQLIEGEWQVISYHSHIWDAIDSIPNLRYHERQANYLVTEQGENYRFTPLFEGTVFDLLPSYLISNLCVVGLTLACGTYEQEWREAIETSFVFRTVTQGQMMRHMDYVAYELLLDIEDDRFDADAYDEEDTNTFPCLSFIGFDLLLEWLADDVEKENS